MCSHYIKYREINYYHCRCPPGAMYASILSCQKPPSGIPPASIESVIETRLSQAPGNVELLGRLVFALVVGIYQTIRLELRRSATPTCKSMHQIAICSARCVVFHRIGSLTSLSCYTGCYSPYQVHDIIYHISYSHETGKRWEKYGDRRRMPVHQTSVKKNGTW